MVPSTRYQRPLKRRKSRRTLTNRSMRANLPSATDEATFETSWLFCHDHYWTCGKQGTFQKPTSSPWTGKNWYSSPHQPVHDTLLRSQMPSMNELVIREFITNGFNIFRGLALLPENPFSSKRSIVSYTWLLSSRSPPTSALVGHCQIAVRQWGRWAESPDEQMGPRRKKSSPWRSEMQPKVKSGRSRCRQLSIFINILIDILRLWSLSWSSSRSLLSGVILLV